MTHKPDGCTCKTCVSMCESRPCWPEPAEAEAMIDAGFGDRLMLDWWVGGGPDDSDILILAPAVEGCEGERAPSFAFGRCNLLTSDGLCSLHTLGLKPREGREVWCDNHPGKKTPENNHRNIAMTWNNLAAQELAQNWYDQHNSED